VLEDFHDVRADARLKRHVEIIAPALVGNGAKKLSEN
jgi:hypothetical protein